MQKMVLRDLSIKVLSQILSQHRRANRREYSRAEVLKGRDRRLIPTNSAIYVIEITYRLPTYHRTSEELIP